MKELLKKIEAQMEQFTINANAHANKGNKAAGMSARKNSLEIAKLLKEYRAESIKH